MGFFTIYWRPQFNSFHRVYEMFQRHNCVLRKIRGILIKMRPWITQNLFYNGKNHRVGKFLQDTHTTAMLVLKDGKISYEQYMLTGGETVNWISFSMAKSYISALLGIALSENLFDSVEDPISNMFLN